MANRAIVFVLNLLQDVNVVRPLVYVAARETDANIVFLISGRFLERDRTKIWQREIGQMCADTSAAFYIYETPLDAFALLQGRGGLLIAASESNLSAHADTHNVFRIAPSSFLKITLQHGYECVGFLQNREHINAHGRNITFAADVVCGWLEASALTALVPSERPKLYVSGPPSVLQAPVCGPNHPPIAGGMVCENLHSVRMKASTEVLPTFMETFFQMCRTLGAYGRGITLRPHPGGQYVLKNKVALPPNITLNNLPFYRVDLARYEFGISAPSTVVIDMLLAGIPTAVWVDAFGAVDASNYEGLTQVTQLADWLAFARDAVLRRDAVLARQSEFLDQLKMPRDPKDVYRRFAQLLANSDAVAPLSRGAEEPPARICEPPPWPHLPPGVLSASAARLVPGPSPEPITVNPQ